MKCSNCKKEVDILHKERDKRLCDDCFFKTRCFCGHERCQHGTNFMNGKESCRIMGCRCLEFKKNPAKEGA